MADAFVLLPEVWATIGEPAAKQYGRTVCNRYAARLTRNLGKLTGGNWAVVVVNRPASALRSGESPD